MAETVTLEFVRNYGQYMAGTTAWFPVAAATPILACGAAKILQPKVTKNTMADRTKAKIVKK